MVGVSVGQRSFPLDDSLHLPLHPRLQLLFRQQAVVPFAMAAYCFLLERAFATLGSEILKKTLHKIQSLEQKSLGEEGFFPRRFSVEQRGEAEGVCSPPCATSTRAPATAPGRASACSAWCSPFAASPPAPSPPSEASSAPSAPCTSASPASREPLFSFVSSQFHSRTKRIH